MTTTQPAKHLDLEDIRPQLDEMRDVTAQTVQQFLDNCPEEFAAIDVADAIVDVCSDEMLDLYQARAERDEYRAKLIAEGYLSDDSPALLAAAPRWPRRADR